MTHIVNTRDFNLSFWVLVLRISNNVHLFCKHFFFFFFGEKHCCQNFSLGIVLFVFGGSF